MVRLLLVCLLGVSVILNLPAPVPGNIDRYVDEDGMVYFTNTPSSGEYVRKVISLYTRYSNGA